MKIKLSLLAIGVAFVFAGCQEPVAETVEAPASEPVALNELDTFAQCVTDNGAVMYGSDSCSHCKSQKKMFGESFSQINYIDCRNNQQKCQKVGIKGYPTWKFADGTEGLGEQKLAQLAKKTGCALPQNLVGPRK